MKIHSISYNILNLPREVRFNDGHIIRYTYDAAGTKLKAECLLSDVRIIDWDDAVVAGDAALQTGGAGLPVVGPGGDTRPMPPGSEVMVEPVTLMTLEYSGGHVYRNGRLERVDNLYGYWADSTFHYHITDYQGNIRAVIAEDGTLEEINSYYPYGGLTGAAGTGVQPHKYGAKELDRENGLDLYDSHARWYDPLLSRTTTQDPLAEKYRHLSPYAWCAGNPMKYIDPDGCVVIFINGMHMNSGGKKKYWDGVDETIKERLGDNSTRYYDGSCGGALNTAVTGILSGNLNPYTRIARGYTVGKNDAETIYGNLTGSETIKIVSHSMGAAYAKGFVLGLLSFAKERHISHKIEMELDLAPFQPMLQKANPDIKNTLTISHWHDGIAGLSFMFGAKNKRTRFGKVSLLPTTEHSIDSFREEIDKYIPLGNKITGGSIMQWEENGNK